MRLEALQAAVEQGDQDASEELARVPDSPITDRLDPGQFTEAVSLLERVTERGSPHAIMTLAWVHQEGVIVPVDLDRAEALMQSALALGHSLAALSLARFYETKKTS